MILIGYAFTLFRMVSVPQCFTSAVWTGIFSRLCPRTGNTNTSTLPHFSSAACPLLQDALTFINA